jgi:hypothetical protein
MIEAGTPGTAARARADALRHSSADASAVAWFDLVADHQSSTGRRLGVLPPAWAILHEVAPVGTDGFIDHLVIGPGGAFIVVNRPCPGELALVDGVLQCGGHPIDGDLEPIRQAAVALTSQLGTPVVPILTLAAPALPPGSPLLAGGVMVCTVERLVGTITKATHTTLSAGRVVELVEAAAPLLNDPTSVARPDRRAISRGGKQIDTARMPDMRPLATTVAGDEPGERVGRRRFTVVSAAIALAVAAVVAGLVVRFIDPAPQAIAHPGTPAASSVAPATDVSVLPPLAAHLTAPSVGFATSCPVSGHGWTLTPLWPGNVPELAEYVLEARSLDGSWRRQGVFASPGELVAAALVGQQPGRIFAARITAVMIDGSTSPNSPTLVQVPKAEC